MSADRRRVAVIQWRFAWATADDAWTNEWARLIGQAAACGARLVVLPAHTGDALLARQRPELGHLSPRTGLDQAWRTSLPDQERASQGQRLWQDYQGIFSRLAAQHGIVLAAGSLLLPAADGRLYHQAALFDTQGELMGSQRACHRSAAERALQVAAGEQLTVFDTAVGRLGLIVGEDLYYPEVARVLALHGAAAFLAPTQRRFGGEAGLLAGLWRDVQGNQAFGLEACLVDPETAPIQSLGSHILGPAELTEDTRGVIAHAATGSDTEVVVGDLDWAARRQLLMDYDITRYFNPRLYVGQLLEAYP